MYKAKNLGMKCGSAAHMYKREFTVWPRGLELLPKGGEWQLTAKEFLEHGRG
jgi:hypothetical protein